MHEVWLNSARDADPVTVDSFGLSKKMHFVLYDGCFLLTEYIDITISSYNFFITSGLGSRG